MKSAWLRAGLKLAIGLLLVGGAMGVRIVMVSAVDREGDLDASGVAANVAPADHPDDGLAANGGMIARAVRADPFGSDSSEALPAVPATESKSRSGDRMVSCRLKDVVHFMTEDDCSMRGGRAKVVQIER